MLGIIVIGIIIFVIFIGPSWMDSDNESKQSIGCFCAIIVVVGGILLSLVGTCSGNSNKSSTPDYYDAPRK
ncbi:hypothetical protein SAMN05216455_107161 [Segatella bryantii]|jgi:hypothetical protein|nr:hypothetical protein SAMN05216455_107161 [Segatella bryantii]